MTETTTKAPLTIRVRDYAMREAEKEIAALGLSDPKAVRQRMTPIYERIRDQIGQQIMSGTRKAYAFTNGKPEPVAADATPRHPLITQLAAWLDGKRREDRQSHQYNEITRRSYSRNFVVTINSEWIEGLHVEDADLAADLAAAKARIAELEARLADLETGGILIEGKEPLELDTAISLYRAVAGQPLPAGLTASQALTAKAEDRCKGWRPEAIKRIVAVCNWDKSTGRKKK